MSIKLSMSRITSASVNVIVNHCPGAVCSKFELLSLLPELADQVVLLMYCNILHDGPFQDCTRLLIPNEPPL